MSESHQPGAVDREREVFLGALDQPAGPKRNAYLEMTCGADVKLRAAVQALLENHKLDAFLETPAAKAPGGRGAKGTVILAATEGPGDRIGRYKLLQEI